MLDFLKHLERDLNCNLQGYTRINGGDINEALQIRSESNSYFVKFNEYASGSFMLRSEAKGIQLLESTGAITTPKVKSLGVFAKKSYLVLDFIPGERPNALFWRNFGRKLAQLHKSSNEFNGLDHDNFIGMLPQRNQQELHWPTFFCDHRLVPQLQLAGNRDRIPSKFLSRLSVVLSNIKNALPNDSPSLLHGDLWGGNFICNTNGQPVLIDPSSYYGHREVDLAMSQLFGGFNPLFYQCYQNQWPLESGFRERFEIYQLYYLLVHLNIFGIAYLSQVINILNKYN